MSSLSRPTPQPIEVNFNVTIDASGNLDVFSQAKPDVPEFIVAEKTLPVTALYDPSGNVGLLELWEPSDAQGDIKVQLANLDTSASGGLNLVGKYQTACKRIVEGFQAILCDTFDCSGATPFSNNNYKSNVNYYKQRDFGRVALATYAHYMFGHVDATAAITNDKAFVEAMLSINAAGDNETAEGAGLRAAAWTKKDTIATNTVETWNGAGSVSDANLAVRLVKALVAKGIVAGNLVQSLVSENDTSKLSHIVGQVVGQDASRLMNVDNNERTLDKHQLLRFYAGDVIFVTITLEKPTVTIGLPTSQLVAADTLKGLYATNESFTIKIILSDSTTPTPTPTVSVDTNFIYSDSTKTVITGYNGTAPNNMLIIPEGVIEIADRAFISGITNKSAITSITIPSTMVTIGSNAFMDFTSLSSIIIPSSVTTIGESAFFRCSGLTSITLSSSITSIGPSIFANCSGLASITIPSSVTSIGNNAFIGCSSLRSITIPSSVTSIGNTTFAHCTGLISITIPSSVTTIGDEAFYNCNSLLSFTIPSSITAIQNSTFGRCTGLTTIVIPSSVTSIGNGAFGFCSGLTSITIPSSVTTIGATAFMFCSALTSITLPNVITIENFVFYNCTSLASVTFTVTEPVTIGNRACYGTALTNVSIKSGSTIVTGPDASFPDGCTITYID